jgi:hypothetical protein
MTSCGFSTTAWKAAVPVLADLTERPGTGARPAKFPDARFRDAFQGTLLNAKTPRWDVFWWPDEANLVPAICAA